ncbi:cobalt ECF transporter T component CbiQ [Kribbia dieselivorans]|uniref:cobalt ECF transporter T component CbiQ n=1 Tax=Kribbia dieselivorans TaxID=331526 RepID=UPI0008390C1F|nr:cobalt ECF transporter T component CbiQ [Kribbia dieselivorans]
MGGAHGHSLHFHGHSVVHRLPAHLKLVALVVYVIAVVATPAGQWWAFGLHAVVLVGVMAATRIPAGYIGRRMLIEVPFVVFALIMPFVAQGPRVQVGPFSLSEAGLLAAATLLLKGTLGVGASVVFAATTEAADIVTGLRRVGLPRQLVEIIAFMVRYLDVVTGQLIRMKVARASRGFSARSVRQWPVLGSTAGALFIRSYERGERVHLAMLSRGYSGAMPDLAPVSTSTGPWVAALVAPAVSVVIAVTALVLR